MTKQNSNRVSQMRQKYVAGAFKREQPKIHVVEADMGGVSTALEITINIHPNVTAVRNLLVKLMGL